MFRIHIWRLQPRRSINQERNLSFQGFMRKNIKQKYCFFIFYAKIYAKLKQKILVCFFKKIATAFSLPPFLPGYFAGLVFFCLFVATTSVWCRRGRFSFSWNWSAAGGGSVSTFPWESAPDFFPLGFLLLSPNPAFSMSSRRPRFPQWAGLSFLVCSGASALSDPRKPGKWSDLGGSTTTNPVRTARSATRRRGSARGAATLGSSRPPGSLRPELP